MYNSRCCWNSSLTPGKSLAAPKYLKIQQHKAMNVCDRTPPPLRPFISHPSPPPSSHPLTSFTLHFSLTCILCSLAPPCLHDQASLVQFSVWWSRRLNIVKRKKKGKRVRRTRRRSYVTRPSRSVWQCDQFQKFAVPVPVPVETNHLDQHWLKKGMVKQPKMVLGEEEVREGRRRTRLTK